MPRPRQTTTAAHPKAAAARQGVIVTDDALLTLAAKGRRRAPLTPLPPQPTFTRRSVYQLRPPPQGVIPAGHPTLAQDDNITYQLGWAGGGNEYLWSEGLGFYGYQYLAEMTQRPEYRRPAEILAKNMTREWIKLEASGEEDKSFQIGMLEADMEKFRLQDVFCRAVEVDGSFGIAHIYVDTGHGDMPEELKTPLLLDKAKIPVGSLRGFKVIEPLWTYPGQYSSTDPLRSDFYRPSTWWVQTKEVHGSRLFTLIGRELPDILKPVYQFGGLSLSQMGKPYVDNWLRTRQSVSDLIHNFSIVVLKTNMAGITSQDGNQAFTNRVDFFNMARDNQNAMLVDKDSEEVENVAVPLGSLDLLQAQAQEHMAAVFGIPLVVLLGVTPSGLNASSDGEIKVFYDWIHAQQRNLLWTPLKRAIDILQLNRFGVVDPDITFRFEPLWQLDAAAQSAMRKTQADTDMVYVDGSVLSPLEVRKRLANEDESPYAGLDVEDLPEVPDPALEMDPMKDPGLEGGETAPHAAGGKPAPMGKAPGVARPKAADAAFNEQDHPRAPGGGEGGGQFTSGGGGGKSGHLEKAGGTGAQRTTASGKALPAHIQALKIPPAWTDVHFSADPDADLLAIGKDSKGRAQYVYSKRFVDAQAEAKFARIRELNQKFGYIERQNEEARSSDNAAIRDSADCMALIMKMGVRPGSDDDTGAKVKAYGATTLEGKHVVRDGNSVRLRFVGKKGVSLDLPVDDTQLAQMLTERAERAGANGKLFPSTNDKALLAHAHNLDGGGFKTKDFRTLVGTREALAQIAGAKAPTDMGAYKKAVLTVAKAVATKLGNTPTIALQSYIDPSVFGAWRMVV